MYTDDDGKVKFLSKREMREALGFEHRPLDVEAVRAVAKDYGATEVVHNHEVIEFDTRSGDRIKIHHPFGTIETPSGTRRQQRIEDLAKVIPIVT